MKFNKNEYWIKHLRQTNTGHEYELGEEWLESSLAERDLGVLVDSRLNRSQQCAPAANRTYLKHSALVRPHLDYCVHFWIPQFKKVVKILE